MSQFRSKQSAKAPLPENLLATDGSFERNTFIVTALDCVVEERRKKEDRDFWPFQA